MLFFLNPRIFHQLLHYFPVHQRLASEKVYFEIRPVSGILYQKIQGPLTCLKTHESPLSVILSLAGKTVGTVQVACMSHMKAQSLDNIFAALFECSRSLCKSIRRIQFSFGLEKFYIIYT